MTQTAPNSAFQEELLPDSHENAPVHQARTAGNNEIVELQNSLRTLRLSAGGLSLLLESTRADLDVSKARVTKLEENIAREANARLFAEGNAVDLNSLLLISDFNLKVVKDNYTTTSLRNAELISQGEERASKICLLNQDLALYVENIKKSKIEILKCVSEEIIKLQNLENTTQNQNSLLLQKLSDATQTIVQKKTEYDLSLEEKMAIIRQNDRTISLLQQCEKELYLELASLRSKMIVLDNSLTERTQTLTDTTNQIVIAEGISIDFNSKLLIANFNRFRLQLQNDEIKQSVHQSATKIAELETQLKKLEAKRIADIADTKQQCQYEYESVLKEQATAIAKLNESLKERSKSWNQNIDSDDERYF